MIVKLKSERRGIHVHECVFVGPDEEHLALAGVLVFDIGQWQEFGAALLLGASKMHGNVKVLTEGDAQVVGGFDEIPEITKGKEPPRSMKERAFRFPNTPTGAIAMARGGAEDCPHGHVFPTAHDAHAAYWVCADCHAWITVPRPGGG
jgi:hypothetical protein